MGSLVSGLCELLIGYFSVSPSSGLLDVASTVGRIFNTVNSGKNLQFSKVVLVFWASYWQFMLRTN